MLDTKKMLQDGFKKKTVFIIPNKDVNGKQHLQIVDTLEHAKAYKCIDDTVQQVTMFYKEEDAE